MTFEQLRIFLAVAERCHVTQAASVLNLTQSAVSAAIAALEAQHGIKLFDRVGRGIVLTEEGRIFMPTARRILAEVEGARVLLEDLTAEPRGKLRIFASQTVASYWLPAHLMALHARHPKLDISLTVGNTAQAAQAVNEGTADMGFIEGTLPPSDLHHQVLARDELVLAVSERHASAQQHSFTAEDYRGLIWVLREEGSGTRSESERHLQDMGLRVQDLDVALELPSNEAVLSAVATGQAVSLLSRRAIAQATQTPILAREITWARHPERGFAVITHPNRHRTRAVSALLDVIAAEQSKG